MRSVTRVFCLCLAGVVFFSASAIHGQNPAELRFEVASVRPSGPRPAGARGGMATTTPERLMYERATFQRLLMDAYGVQRGQIRGPAWATSEAIDGAALFDISARVPVGATKEQIAVMLQNLLKDRFKLAVHWQKGEVAAFALVVAKGGAKLKPSAGPPLESERNQTESGTISLRIGSDGFPELFRDANMGGVFKDGTARVRFRDYLLSDLAQQFSRALAMPLIDRTGLAGRFDFTLEFTPPENASQVGGLAVFPFRPGQTLSIGRQGPTPGQLDSISVVSSAMERQLGLKLEATRTVTDTLVIDSVERTPIEN